ncbi:hypothetical protein [Amycolatopsis sp. lyj-112]|uniref:hypothetical protein n=1 Tax=Amycolatopsis sp. lyj-112 TaxID=2789288 RepID=UPI00397E3B06
MNTVDPAQARRARLEHWRGHPGVLAGAIVASAALLVFAFSAGYGFGGILEQFRTMAIDSVFDDRGDGEPPYEAIWGTFGLLGTIAAGALAGTAVRRYQGRPKSPAFPAVLAMAATTVGLWVSSLGWLPPLAVGIAVDPVFHTDEKWGFWGWAMYYADWWAPAGLLVLTVLALVHAVKATREYAEMVRTRERLLTYGRRVRGEVVEVKPRIAGDESGSRVVGATVTVAFFDTAGVRRWVTRRTSETSIAGFVEVLFDPVRPGDEKSIFVALRREPALSDWLPTD